MALDQDKFYRNLTPEHKLQLMDDIAAKNFNPKTLGGINGVWHGEIKHCPTCNDIRITSCCACGCGSCYTCNHRFSCLPVFFTSAPRGSIKDIDNHEWAKILGPPVGLDQVTEGLGLSKTPEERLSRWIDAIANDETCEIGDIIDHIQKHFGEELIEEYNSGNLDQWLASSENLLDILKKMAKLRSNTELRLQRLQEQVDRFPDSRTPEPEYE